MITQARFSKNVRFFERDFLKRWSLRSYNDERGSCFFAGVYSDEDVNIINRHKGLKVVWNTSHKRDLFDKLDPDVVVMIGNGIEADIQNYKTRRVNIEIKDFSIFKPVRLGKCVYVYLGKPKYKERYGSGIVEAVGRRIPFKVIKGYLGHDISVVKKEYYDKSFINIKTSIAGGLTTATEMAHMGRKTISNTKAVFCYPYKDVDDIVDMIMKESKNIGTVPKSIIPDDFFTGGQWLHESFWL